MLETAAVLCEQSSKKYNLVNHIRFLLCIPIFQVPQQERQMKMKMLKFPTMEVEEED